MARRIFQMSFTNSAHKVHQLCLIHIMRNLFKFLQPFEQQYRQGRRQIAKARESFNLKQETHDFRADKLKKLHQQVRYWESQRSTLQQQYGVQSFGQENPSTIS